MKTQLSVRNATWFSLAAAFVLIGALLMRVSATATGAAHGNLGQVLALRSALSASKSFFQGAADAGYFDPRHAANGRFVYTPSELLTQTASHRGAASPRAGNTNSVNITEPVQTYDVFAPPPAFAPVTGTNSNGPVVDPTVKLTPTNLTPVWTADQHFIVFASNRDTSTGGNPLAVAADGHYHIWAVDSLGSAPPFPITTGPGDEEFPALNASNGELAFASTALQTTLPGNASKTGLPHDLFTIPFSETAGTPVNVATLTSQLNNVKTFGNSGGVGDVQRPTWSPVSDQLLVFSAMTQQPSDPAIQPETYTGHYHLYYINVSTNGYQNTTTQGVPNPPAKLTDGPADDTDPTWEPAGGGDYIAFASTASALNRNSAFPANNQPNPNPPAFTAQNPLRNPAPTLSSAPANASGNRNIFVVNAGQNAAFGLVPQGGGRITNATDSSGNATASDNFGPAWSLPTPNQYLNPENGSAVFEYLAFARNITGLGSGENAGPANNHDIYYLRAISNVGTATVAPEGQKTGGFNSDGTPELNRAVKLNTDDNGAVVTTSATNNGTTTTTTTVNNVNGFDDIYPTWSPLLSVFSIAYSSNRSITYNDPTTGHPVEKAVSLIPGSGNVGAGTGAAFSTGQPGAYPAYNIVPGDASGAPTGYTGILQSQILNLDPPTLRSFSGSEIIHINNGSQANTNPGSAVRILPPGSTVTFTTRLSDREAGIANIGANGLPDVYLQIKNPNSRYQDSQGLEHKVFARDAWYYNVTDQDTPQEFYGFRTGNGHVLHPRTDSGSSSLLLQDIGDNDVYLPGDLSHQFATGFNTIPYPTATANPPPLLRQVGAIGGPDRDSVNGTISVGHDGGGANSFNNMPLLPLGIEGPSVAGGDWRNFIPLGPEYECQYVNPSITATGRDPSTTPGDYGIPFYLAGFDDQGAFSGYDPLTGDITNGSHPPRPASGGTTSQWLQMKMLPATSQDNLGGVLYSATWKTPNAPSDFYLDVIAFDNARFPELPQDTSNYANAYGSRAETVGSVDPITSQIVTVPTNISDKPDNWRIYDNIWGFTTQQNIAQNKDILVVSDYALGQKFAFSTFGGQFGASNLPPKQFGAESYVTDVDVNILPNAAFMNYIEPGVGVSPVIQRFNIYNSGQPGLQPDQTTGVPSDTQILNGLGVDSYYDPIVGQQDDKDPLENRYPYVRSQQYAIYRTLCRGPLDNATLRGYEPQFVNQPAVADTQAGHTFAAASVPDARRCILWIAPFTNDLLTPASGSGSLIDNSTQASLETFVNAGGRLGISGQDVASGLASSGQTTQFLSTVLNSTLKSSNGGGQVIAGAGQRVTGSGQNGGGNLNFFEYLDEPGGGITFSTFIAPSASGLRLTNTLGPSGDGRLDASYDQIGPRLLVYGLSRFQGQDDTLNPLTGATGRTTVTDGSYTDPGLIYYQDANTGSRVVYAAFGLEALSTDYYTWYSETAANPAFPNGYKIGATAHFSPHNTRQNVLHNIVDYLRTGTITGVVVQSANGASGGTQPVPGATVYLLPTNGTALTGRGTYSGTAGSDGSYTISGIDPGNYYVAAYSAGFNSAQSKTFVEVEGDTVVSEDALDIEPVNGALISGTVTDTNGKAIGGATVTFTNTTPGFTNIAITTQTNNDGTYGVNVPATGGATAGSPAVYVGQASKLPTFGVAPPLPPNDKGVSVNSGDQKTGVNFQLSAAPGTITGQVTDTSGAAVAGATVTATTTTSGSSFRKVADNLTDSNGNYTISNLPAGSYTLTATKATFTQVGTPPVVPVTAGVTTAPPTTPVIQLKPAVNVTLNGTVFANAHVLAGATVTITRPDGTTAAGPFTTDANGAFTTSLTQGQYTITASFTGFQTTSQTVNVQSDPTTVTLTLSVQPATHTFTGGHYNFVSLPYDDLATTAFDDVFGPLITSAGGNRSQAAIYQSTIHNYVYDPQYPADRIRAGRGYFVYLRNDKSVFNIPGTPPSGATVTIPLLGGSGLDGWNMIGVPSTTPINVSGPTGLHFQFANGVTTDFAGATKTYGVVDPTLYGYNPTTNAYTPVTAGGTLQPFQGYWIRTKTNNLSVLIPTSGG